MRAITQYWGKARPVKGAGVAWHPAAYHSLDVAAAMAAMLTARPAWLKTLAAMAGLPEAETRTRLVLVAALHDIGKFAENFQHKVPALAVEFGHALKMSSVGHGSVGLRFWERHKRALGLGALTDWLFAAVSHHGTPVEAIGNLAEAMTPAAEQDASAFAADAIALIGTPDNTRVRGDGPVWAVAGLVMLADWIGSNQDWFPYHPPILSLESYWALAQRQAAAALVHAELREAPAAPVFDLDMILERGVTPSPVQAWAAAYRAETRPQLILIEDFTGAGKSEAALILAHRLIQAGAAEGLYWALPSMATANGLYRRLQPVYKKLFDASSVEPSLVLAHSARDVNTAFQLSRRQGKPARYGIGDQDQSAEAACAEFIAEDRKKTFLAQIGIGTLDQALLGALPVRHQAVRLLALSRRVLIVDEAHSYDPYMNRGLEHLLKFHFHLGGSAIILSATMTQAQKQRLARIYGGAATALTETGFPLVSQIAPGVIRQTKLPARAGIGRDLPYRRFDSPDAVMPALIEQARAGFCAVYIRNTVREVLEAYDWLRSRWQDVELFHARLTLGDRMERENAVLTRFGKDSTEAQRRGLILVATQVVEQSLDLDFDVMATDLCPVDLLIQRAGRLQRHHHRPPRPAPVLWIVSAPADESVGPGWVADLFRSGQYIYPDTGQLWRGLRVIEQQGGIHLASRSPRGLIEPVLGAEPIPTPAALDPGSIRAQGKRDEARGVAGQNFLKPDGFTPQNQGWASDVATPTRLGAEMITLRLACWADGVLQPWNPNAGNPWRLSEIAVRAGHCDQPLTPDPEAAAAIKAADRGWIGREPPPILALTPSADAGIWQGRWQDKAGKISEIRYSREQGLWVEAGR